MRDPTRVRRISSLIQQLWERYPDLRYFQLVAWLESAFAREHPQWARTLPSQESGGSVVDLFNLEDEVLECWLTDLLQQTEN